jgi:hypothetical protein
MYIGKDLLSVEAKSREQAAAAYTLNTTIEWWKEYTTVPPMQHADVSRRKVIAYYTNSSCSACDACPRVRIDSRSWPHVALSHTLPALLAPGKHLTMHIQPSEEDWLRTLTFLSTYTSMRGCTRPPPPAFGFVYACCGAA